MKLIDRYILKGFAFSFLVVFVSMVALTIMVDMVVNIDEFLKTRPDGTAIGAWGVAVHVVSYYFFRTFEYFQWLCGAAMLVGAAFAVARLNKSNELVAFKASGVSVYRLLWPIIAAGLAISALYVVNQEFIIPNIIDHLVAERSAAESSDEFTIKYVRDGSNALIYAPRYHPGEQAMMADIDYAADGRTVISRQMVSIAGRNPETDENLFFIEAERADYDPKRQGGGWVLTKGLRWSATAGEDTPDGATAFSREEPIDFFPSDMDPKTLLRQRRRDFYRYLSFGRISQLLRESALINADLYEVVMHQHFAKPILNLVILLLGLPFVVGQEGKTYFASIVVCIGLFVLVLGTEYAAAEFGSHGHIAPILAAYLPVLLFTPLAVLCMDGIRT